MRSRKFREEDGGSLAIVLMVITVFAVIAAGLLTEASASMKYTTSITNYEDKVYAADGGVSLGIQQLQQNTDVCPTTGSTGTIETVSVNGYTTSIGCETTSGSTEGGLGYAIITRSPGAQSLYVQGGSAAKLVNGPVYVTGQLDGFPNPGVQVTNGNFRQKSGNGCTSTKPSGLTVDAGYGYFCQTAEPTDVVPTAPSIPSTARTAVTSGSCKYFFPGTYTSAPTLGTGTNYFASGVYYFNFSGVWNATEALYGGKPASWEAVQYDSPAGSGSLPTCATDTNAITAAGGNASEVTGTGAQFIFGGGASMRFGNGSQVEIFTRTLDGTAATRTASYIAVPDSWVSSGWTESTDNTTILDFSNGSNPDSVIHGLVYVPEQNARLYSTNGVDAAVLGGIIAWKLELQSSASGSGLSVSASDGVPDPRHIVITATAPATPDPSKGQQVISTAVVEIANNDSHTVTVRSWRTRRATDAL